MFHNPLIFGRAHSVVIPLDTTLFLVSSQQVVPFPDDVEIEQLAAHPSGRHYLALSVAHDVYSWGEGENGQLGLGNGVK